MQTEYIHVKKITHIILKLHQQKTGISKTNLHVLCKVLYEFVYTEDKRC